MRKMRLQVLHAVLTKNTQCPEDDKQREWNTQQPENERFPHDGLSFTPANLELRRD
jgi:hypothetical protein